MQDISFKMPDTEKSFQMRDVLLSWVFKVQSKQ